MYSVLEYKIYESIYQANTQFQFTYYLKQVTSSARLKPNNDFQAKTLGLTYLVGTIVTAQALKVTRVPYQPAKQPKIKTLIFVQQRSYILIIFFYAHVNINLSFFMGVKIIYKTTLFKENFI